MRSSRALALLLALPVTVALLAPLALAEPPAPDDACAPGGAPAARLERDAHRPHLLVRTEVLCVADAGATTSATSPADGCTATAYTLGGHRWDAPLSFRVDTRGAPLDATAAVAALSAGGQTWDVVAAADVIGTVSPGGDASKVGTRDQVNQMGWRDLGATGVLARTTTWFTSAGRAIESDIAYNTAYGWSASGGSGRADLQSVATHEIGHALGLDHAPDVVANACLTMFPRTALGSTAQRTLGAGDVLGIQKIYGAASEPAPAPAPFAPTFSPKPGNEWWVEVRVSADRALAGVTASVDGGAPVTLSKTSWGTWAKSFHVPTGSAVRFTAKATDGASATSGAYRWPDATPVGAAPLTATFTKHASNTWWIEVRVSADAALSGVTASVNGGAPVALTKTSWGTWAKSVYAPAGSEVVFVARATDGRTATSAPFAWP